MANERKINERTGRGDRGNAAIWSLASWLISSHESGVARGQLAGAKGDSDHSMIHSANVHPQ